MAFGLTDDSCGPIAALDPADIPALMATVETDAAERGVAEMSFTVPMTNATAIDHALARGFQLDTWFGFVLSSSDEMRLDRYILTQPTYIL
jgi:hypothetical protein